jgi:hypothetical protein
MLWGGGGIMRWIAMFFVVTPFIFGCAGRTTHQPQLAANVKVQEWNVTPAGDNWTITIWYDIRNTGIQVITGYSIHAVIDVEGSKTVIADCWGPSKTEDDYRNKKASGPISPEKTGRCVIVLDIPYKPMRVSIELEKLK